MRVGDSPGTLGAGGTLGVWSALIDSDLDNHFEYVLQLDETGDNRVEFLQATQVSANLKNVEFTHDENPGSPAPPPVWTGSLSNYARQVDPAGSSIGPADVLLEFAMPLDTFVASVGTTFKTTVSTSSSHQEVTADFIGALPSSPTMALASVPEPSTLVLMFCGVAAVGVRAGWRKLRRRR